MLGGGSDPPKSGVQCFGGGSDPPKSGVQCFGGGADPPKSPDPPGAPMAACGAVCFSAAGPKQNGSFGPQMAKNGCLTYRNSKYNLYYFLKFPLPGRPPPPRPSPPPGAATPPGPPPGTIRTTAGDGHPWGGRGTGCLGGGSDPPKSGARCLGGGQTPPRAGHDAGGGGVQTPQAM